MSYLLDTNVVSEIRKAVPNSHFMGWLAPLPNSELYISVLVVGEIRRGIELLRRRDGRQAEVFEQCLA